MPAGLAVGAAIAAALLAVRSREPARPQTSPAPVAAPANLDVRPRAAAPPAAAVRRCHDYGYRVTVRVQVAERVWSLPSIALPRLGVVETTLPVLGRPKPIRTAAAARVAPPAPTQPRVDPTA